MAESFYSQEPPPTLSAELDSLRAFLAVHAAQNRRVVLVTSGGTTVPLEHNVVRFLDNFSAGTRGAASAEYFLRTGKYAVVFMHRQFSLHPFTRHYSHSTNPFLELLQLDPADAAPQPSASEPCISAPLFPRLTNHSSEPAENTRNRISVKPSRQGPLTDILRSYQLVHSLNLLHSIPFVTVHEYLFLLRGVSELMGTLLGRNAMYYLAAAVSDFFIPRQRMSEHKIQSGKGSLIIEMDQVPKVLRQVVKEWSNEGFIVSFKLETDNDLLIPKAQQALERYGHQLVIGNDLANRKQKVAFVRPQSSASSTTTQGSDSDPNVEWIYLDDKEYIEIEEQIIDRVVDLHSSWVDLETR